MGIRASDLPPPGETLRVEALQVLAVVLGAKWKREDVGASMKNWQNALTRLVTC